MEPKDVREYVRHRLQHCPNCGTPVMVAIRGTDRHATHGIEGIVISVEDAEERLRENRAYADRFAFERMRRS